MPSDDFDWNLNINNRAKILKLFQQNKLNRSQMDDAFLKKSLAQFYIDINKPSAVQISIEEEEKMNLTDERDITVS